MGEIAGDMIEDELNDAIYWIARHERHDFFEEDCPFCQREKREKEHAGE